MGKVLPTNLASTKALDGKDPPLVSIIIPTKNSATTLNETLQSISNQTCKQIEVIVVDNYSEDRTREIAVSFPNVRVCLQGPERATQINFGARMTSGKYLYRVDSDTVLESTVVEEAVMACENSVRAVLIHNTSDPSISFWAKVRKLERDCYRDENSHVAVRFMRREDFIRVGGFLESLVAGEDYDLHLRLKKLGITIGRIQAKELHRGEPRSLGEVVWKHIYYGTKITAFINANPKASWIQLSPFRLAYLRHLRDFLVDWRVTLGFFIYQYVRYTSAMIGLIEQKLGIKN